MVEEKHEDPIEEKDLIQWYPPGGGYFIFIIIIFFLVFNISFYSIYSNENNKYYAFVEALIINISLFSVFFVVLLIVYFLYRMDYYRYSTYDIDLLSEKLYDDITNQYRAVTIYRPHFTISKNTQNIIRIKGRLTRVHLLYYQDSSNSTYALIRVGPFLIFNSHIIRNVRHIIDNSIEKMNKKYHQG